MIIPVTDETLAKDAVDEDGSNFLPTEVLGNASRHLSTPDGLSSFRSTSPDEKNDTTKDLPDTEKTLEEEDNSIETPIDLDSFFCDESKSSRPSHLKTPGEALPITASNVSTPEGMPDATGLYGGPRIVGNGEQHDLQGIITSISREIATYDIAGSSPSSTGTPTNMTALAAAVPPRLSAQRDAELRPGAFRAGATRSSAESTEIDLDDSQRGNPAAISSLHHEIRAELVDTAEEQERQAALDKLRAIVSGCVVTEVEMTSGNESESRWKIRALACITLTIFAIGVAIGIAVATVRGNDVEESAPFAEVPTSGPTFDMRPTAIPSILSTAPFDCFSSRSDLLEAVDIFLANRRNEVAQLESRWGLIADWCVSDVTDFGQLFDARRNIAASFFDEDISGWDVSSCQNFSHLFRRASAFNQPLNTWNTSKVFTLAGMFENAISFNQDLSNWDTSSVVNMKSVFRGAASFNGNVSSWNTAKVLTFEGFARDGATSFNQDLELWDTSSAEVMRYALAGAVSFNGSIGSWNTAKVVDFEGFALGATSFNQDLNGWNTSSAETLNRFFAHATSFNGDISTWDVGRVATFERMFFNATSFNRSLCSWGNRLEARIRAEDPQMPRMFNLSGCEEEGMPDLLASPIGPFCTPCV